MTRSNKSKNIKIALKSVGAGMVGGFAGNQLTNVLEEQFAKSGNVDMMKAAPILSGAAGFLLAAFMPKLSEVGVGMATVSGVELLQNAIASAKTSATGTAGTTTAATEGSVNAASKRRIRIANAVTPRVPPYMASMNGVDYSAYNEVY